MIFPPESIYEFRGELVAKMESGELSDAEAFRQALAVDPHDPAATRLLAFAAEKYRRSRSRRATGPPRH